MTTNVPPLVIDGIGITTPSTGAIFTGVITDIDDAFGGGLNQNVDTPQGQLATSLTAIVADKNSQILSIANNTDPIYADGRWQDALGRIYFLTRVAAVPTVVQCTVSGVAGTVIPFGTLAKDTSGNTYQFTGAYTIGPGGTVTAELENLVSGPIPCAANTLNKVHQTIAGWDAINNPSGGTLGRDIESRADFEYRRRASVASNAKGTIGAIRGAVFAVDDVIDVYVIDNPLPTAQNIGATNYAMSAHSVYVGVVGGDDTAVAREIWLKKDVGCSYNGNTTVLIDDTEGYVYPYPTYTVKFHRPASLPIKFEVTIRNSPSNPYNTNDLIKAAIVARFSGSDGSDRERMGNTIYASRYYSAVAVLQNITLVGIEIGTSTPNLQSIAVGIDQRPTITDTDITVVLI